jgi:legume-like lectin family protein
MKTALFALLIIVVSHGASNAQYVFAINDFQATSEKLSLVGSAHYFEDRLRITPAQANAEGACWYKASQISLENGFETEFNFLISGSSSEPGDGFAFVMQNQSPTALGGKGDGIGYKEIPYVMAIEFDTKNDDEGSKNHVNLSFYKPDTKEYRRYATVHEIPEITDGNPHFTKVIYHDGELQVFLDSYIFPVLSVRIDIAPKVRADEGKIWVGFTSATSNATSNHDLLQWTLRAFEPEPEDIEVETVQVYDANAIQVTKRKLRVQVWDHNTIDGDIVSLKWGNKWVLTDYVLTAEPYEINLTLHGFENSLTLYANNVGQVPPNTAMISVFDGVNYFKQELNADLKTSEALVIQYRGKQE